MATWVIIGLCLLSWLVMPFAQDAWAVEEEQQSQDPIDAPSVEGEEGEKNFTQEEPIEAPSVEGEESTGSEHDSEDPLGAPEIEE
ncbi:MAG: hypothetical protein ACLFPX_05725 [Candidatus Omnitrophota bacterium]